MKAVKLIRRLKGSSQPILAQADDDQLYVLKFLSNPQGPQVLANEALGTEAYRLAGLPVPDWQIVYVSEKFIDQNPDCWFESRNTFVRPVAGCCFGSLYLAGQPSESASDFLTDDILLSLKNRADFVTAAAVDLLLGEDDGRQAIFLKSDDHFYEAFFIDHGRGPMRDTEDGRSYVRYYDRRVYPPTRSEASNEIQKVLTELSAETVTDIFHGIPISWRLTGLPQFLSVLQRVSDPALIAEAARRAVTSAEFRERDAGDIYDGRWEQEGMLPALLSDAPASRPRGRTASRDRDS